MDDLIKALMIFRKYDNPQYPTSCEHDVLYVFVNPEIVNYFDIQELKGLGFHVNEDGFGFYSFRYGSA